MALEVGPDLEGGGLGLDDLDGDLHLAAADEAVVPAVVLVEFEGHQSGGGGGGLVITTVVIK